MQKQITSEYAEANLKMIRNLSKDEWANLNWIKTNLNLNSGIIDKDGNNIVFFTKTDLAVYLGYIPFSLTEDGYEYYYIFDNKLWVFRDNGKYMCRAEVPVTLNDCFESYQ